VKKEMKCKECEEEAERKAKTDRTIGIAIGTLMALYLFLISSFISWLAGVGWQNWGKSIIGQILVTIPVILDLCAILVFLYFVEESKTKRK
jgi:ABC-type antimicrobial peptide transport system permease subunit